MRARLRVRVEAREDSDLRCATRYAVRAARPRPVRVQRTYRAWRLGASCPAPLVRTVHRRLVRAASTYSTEAPGHTSQHRSDRKIEAELVQTRVVLLSLKVDDLPWETGSRSGFGQSARPRPASARSSSGPAAFSLYQPRPIGRGRRDRACSPQAGDHRVAVLAGRVAGHAAGAVLARAAPHEPLRRLALRLLRRRGLCGRTNKRTTCTALKQPG